ncbi:uncharacterized protein KGF55_005132 [Candida pseudojiufengensis]|uniref:uncharacterized protein n=1 Tax=Candida pseudojiufengensis TaxID=497109 RepID=UPI002225191E|nr:uncharacterized protein KGF55_005132 [Candida pseudojiufengensis]KAI5959900.1 hypothetical protein KGF55_005132 [Candida pseudojiufengensis]
MFFRRITPSYILIGILVISVIIFNISILTTSSSDTFKYTKDGGATYYTGGKKAMQAHIDKVDSEEFLASIMKELEETKKEEILADYKIKISKLEKPKIIQDLKTEMRQKYLEKIKDTLKDEIKEESTNEIYKQNALSYDLYQKLINEYAKEHVNEFKPAVFLDILSKEIDEFQIPLEFENKIEKSVLKYFNRKKYFQYLIKDILISNRPNCEPLSKDEKGKKLNPTFQWDTRLISEKYLRESNLNIPGDKFKCLQFAHDNVVKQLKTLPDPPNQFISGDGIVINAGGGMIPGALTVITNLRDQGSSLPVEMILDTKEEYDKQICEDLLPNVLNGKCIIIENEIGKEIYDLIPGKFSKKIVGFLISSFDNIIALDADNFAIKNVDSLLYTEPFLSTKMILWPDVWVKLTSPLYYKIARIEKGEPIHRFGISNDDKFYEYIQKDKSSEIHFHDFANLPNPISTETGQIVFSKKEHMRSLLLTLYYNLNLKDWYEDLLFQGAFGEGDRETFVPALHVMNERYHLMNQKINRLGYEAENGEFSDTVLTQTDPRDNIEFYKDWKKFLTTRNLDTRLNPFQSGDYTNKLIEQFKDYKKKIIEDKKIEDEDTAHRLIEYNLPQILFLHCNHPKIDPIKNSQEGEFGTYSRRSMGKPEKIYQILPDKDWELRFHSIAKWIACDAITSSDYWQKIAKLDQKTTCFKIKKYIDFLKLDTLFPDSEFQNSDVLNFKTFKKLGNDGDKGNDDSNNNANVNAQAQAQQDGQMQAQGQQEVQKQGQGEEQAKKLDLNKALDKKPNGPQPPLKNSEKLNTNQNNNKNQNLNVAKPNPKPE